MDQPIKDHVYNTNATIGGINENGYWDGLEAGEQHAYDETLSQALLTFFKNEKIESLVDLGCGMGNYVQHFKKNNLNASGFDGNPHTPVLTNNTCDVLDLSKPTKFNTPFTWVMSLEVGEHLPKIFEDIFINNLHNNNEIGIVLSWALKGQGGHGHVNEQNNDYIKSKICNLGYINDTESEELLRKQSSFSYFKKSIMVFRKIYLYPQDNYKLCLTYNKPVHLNTYIDNLSKSEEIGNYITDYRKYFYNEEAGIYENKNQILENKIMIDVGAHIGLSSCPLLSKGNTVYCFEPEKINYEIIKHVKKINNFQNMFINNVAVGNKNEKVKLYSNIFREDNSSLNEECCKKNTCPIGIIEREIDCITLDNWYQDNKKNVNIGDIKLIKVDTQGSELSILKGAKNLILSCSFFNCCNIELETDSNFMNIMNTNLDEITKYMNYLGFKDIQRGYDSIFIPNNPIPKNLTIIFKEEGQLCNILKNFISCQRLSNHFGCKIVISEDAPLSYLSLFDVTKYKTNNIHDNIVVRRSWRLAILNSDNNIDLVSNNEFSKMFEDFEDQLFFKNYNYNSIDFLYNHDLFYEIYNDYSNLFNILLDDLFNKNILKEVNSFYDKYFDSNTISIHIRSWIDAPDRGKNFDINKFYKEMDKLSDKNTKFFVCSDDKKYCNELKQYQKNKGLDNVIIYQNSLFNRMEIALIELLLLSKNNIIIGSFISTFTEMAFIANYNINKKIIIV